MDWKKSSTILIVAFIILNVFLFISFYNNTFSEEYNVMSDELFVERVKDLLQQKNISINCNIPSDAYTLPILDTEYEIIQVDNELLNKYLGIGVEAVEGIYEYNNENGESIEIIDGKKLTYTIRENLAGNMESEENIIKKINDFVEEKNIKMDGYSQNFKYVCDDYCYYSYTKIYNEYSVDNSYLNFYLDSQGIYKFEMQRIDSLKEIMGKVRTITAIEALTRLLTYDDIRDKEITNIEMTYYSAEDENWHNINRINSDPTWKIIFSDGSQKHLPSND